MATLTALGLLGLATARADPPALPDAGQRPTLLSTADPTVPTSGAVRAQVADDPWSSPDIVAPLMDARPLPRRSGVAAQTESPPAGTGRSGFRTTLALGGVVGLIVLLAWGYRVAATRGGARWTFRARHPGLIEVLSRTALSPRQSLYLVRVGPRLVLLGATHDAVRALDVICDPELVASLAGQAARQRPNSHTAEFNRCLERETAGYSPATTAGETPAPLWDRGSEPPGTRELEETPMSDAGRLAGVRQTLASTLERLRTVGTG